MDFCPDLALPIHEAPEGEHSSGAGLQAGGLNLAVENLSSLVFGFIMSFFNPLDAERTFFHDPFAAHGNIRVQLEVQRFRPFPLEPVEAPHLVRTVLRAKAGADAAFKPSFEWWGAYTGQTDSQGALSQCWQSMGRKVIFSGCAGSS
jgi:hypothetical protein